MMKVPAPELVGSMEKFLKSQKLHKRTEKALKKIQAENKEFMASDPWLFIQYLSAQEECGTGLFHKYAESE